MLLLCLSLILSLINIFCLGGSSQKSSFLRILETRVLILLLLSTFKKLIFARLIFVDFRVFFGKFTKNLILQSYIELVPVLKSNILLLQFALIFGNFATTYSPSEPVKLRTKINSPEIGTNLHPRKLIFRSYAISMI